MLGLSITAIGMRSLDQCLDIFQRLQEPMQLQYLELAIGSPCGVEVDYGDTPLILHDACLYQERILYRLLRFPETRYRILAGAGSPLFEHVDLIAGDRCEGNRFCILLDRGTIEQYSARVDY